MRQAIRRSRWPRSWDWAKTIGLLVTLPLWLPLLLLVGAAAMVVNWAIIKWHTCRSVKSAWATCARVWLRENWVWVGWTDSTFTHGLLPSFAKTHRRKRAFFLERLRSPEPVLAAYACLCLVETGGFSLDEVPNDVRQRGDIVRVRCGDMIDAQPLASFVTGLASSKEA